MSELTDKVDAIFAAWDKTNSPGCALAVMQGGEIVYKRGYGMANLECDVSIKPTSIFHVASVSKQFTAMAIALLHQDGKLSVDDDVRQYIPELPDYGHTITIRHLVYHTSGIRDQWDLLELAGWRDNDLVNNTDALKIAARQKSLNFNPGDEYLYSNTGYTLLALIVERVTGRSFREFTTERIFRPLAMHNTHFQDKYDRIVPNRTYAYLPDKDEGLRNSIPVFDTVGATSLFTTVEDLARWENNFYDKTVGGEDANRLMLEPARLNTGEEIEYAFGLRLIPYKGLKTFGHSGADAGYRSEFICFPEHRFAVIILCNLGTMNPNGLAKQVADIYLADHLKDDDNASGRVELTEQKLLGLAGLYRDAQTGMTRRLTVQNGMLTVSITPEFQLPLQPLSPERFTVVGFPVEVRFTYAEDGKPLALHLDSGMGKPIVYDAVEVVDPSSDQLSAYTGTYYSDELDTIYTIDLEDSSLVMRHRKLKDNNLIPTVKDAFAANMGDIQFTYADHNTVNGFTLLATASSRVRGIHFDRQS